MKEGALVGVVTIGLLVALVAVVASGFEDSGVITMARHFPVSKTDLADAENLGHAYARCQLDFVHRNRAQYRVASVLADSSVGVCAVQLAPVSKFLVSKGYAPDVVTREVRYIKEAEDADSRRLVMGLY